MFRAEIEPVSTLAADVYTAARDYVSCLGRFRGIPPRDDAAANAMTTAEVVACAFLLREDHMMKLGAKGVDYLIDAQTHDGCWTDPASPDPWDVSSTAWAVSALLASGMRPSDNPVARACSWLRASVLPGGGLPTNRSHSTANTYATAYCIRALALAGDYAHVNRCIGFIRDSQNWDGGWGLAHGDPSEPTLTSHVLHGLVDAGRGGDTLVVPARDYLLSSQRSPGLWSAWFEPSPSVEGTAFCSYVLLRSMPSGLPNIAQSLSFIADRVRLGTAWRVGQCNHPWIAVSCMLLASQVLQTRADRNGRC